MRPSIATQAYLPSCKAQKTNQANAFVPAHPPKCSRLQLCVCWLAAQAMMNRVHAVTAAETPANLANTPEAGDNSEDQRDATGE